MTEFLHPMWDYNTCLPAIEMTEFVFTGVG